MKMCIISRAVDYPCISDSFQPLCAKTTSGLGAWPGTTYDDF
jgi:hypothetical protein